MKLRDYQEKAVDFIYERDRAMILASVGAGKTAISLTGMRDMIRDGHVKRWLVFAPKRVCTNTWPTEKELWAPELKLALALGSPKQRQAALESDADIVVINYENIQTLENLSRFDGLVFDELTKLKNPSGKRFKHLEKLVKDINIRWGLTGSFTSNGLEDVFGQCKIVDQSLLGRSKGAFQQRYFVCINRDFGEWEPRIGSLEAVMHTIKPATFLLDNSEYKDKLPPLHTVEMRCDLPDRQPYEKMKKDFVVQFPDAKAVAANAAVVTQKLQQMASGFVYDTSKEANPDMPGNFIVTKRPIWFSSHRFDLLDDLLEENQHANTIIVYNYEEELAELKRRYPRAETIDAPQVVDRWNDGKVELLLIHPKSAGHGLNLQYGGNKIVFLSLPWSLELFEQTVGRLHRGGQKHDVWCYILLTNKTIDEKVWASLADKRAISDIALEELK
jgi:SNF2 family DNA or RNA helicase